MAFSDLLYPVSYTCTYLNLDIGPGTPTVLSGRFPGVLCRKILLNHDPGALVHAEEGGQDARRPAAPGVVLRRRLAHELGQPRLAQEVQRRNGEAVHGAAGHLAVDNIPVRQSSLISI